MKHQFFSQRVHTVVVERFTQVAKNMNVQRENAFQKANHYGAIALVCLSLAIVCFSIGIFSANPESIFGLIFLCLGIISVLSSYVFFALFSHFSKKQ